MRLFLRDSHLHTHTRPLDALVHLSQADADSQLVALLGTAGKSIDDSPRLFAREV